MDTGYESGTNKYKARAIANWAPCGTCYYHLVGRATVRIHTGEGRDTRTGLYQDRRA